MGRKIFISYKYIDSDVAPLPGVMQPTWPSDYVDYTVNYLLPNDSIYKGESQDNDLSSWPDERIWAYLKDKLYDSSLTIVFISPNMREPGRWQKSQWIPQEISYSLRKTTRGNRTSQRNAILAVVLPNSHSAYSYYSCDELFPILRDNINSGYIKVVSWDKFIKRTDECINQAYVSQSFVEEYEIYVGL